MRQPPPVPAGVRVPEDVFRFMGDLDRAVAAFRAGAGFHFEPGPLGRSLCNRFRRINGQSVQRTLSNLRIDLARELLLRSDASPSHVARSVGYASYSSFRIHFRIRTGCAPMDYRKSASTSPGGAEAVPVLPAFLLPSDLGERPSLPSLATALPRS